MAGPERGSPSGQPPTTTISHRELDGVFVVAVNGEVDVANVRTLGESARQLPNTAMGLIIDLTGATFIDSSTVGLLFQLGNELARRGQVLKVAVTPGSPPARVLELTAFDKRSISGPEVATAIAEIRTEVPVRADSVHQPEERL